MRDSTKPEDKKIDVPFFSHMSLELIRDDREEIRSSLVKLYFAVNVFSLATLIVRACGALGMSSLPISLY